MLLITKELTERIYKGKNNNGYDLWVRQVECLCDCGTIVNREYATLPKMERLKRISNCGCLKYHKKSKDLARIEGIESMSRKEKYDIVKDLIRKGFNNVEIYSATGVSHSKTSNIRKEIGANYYTIDKDDIKVGMRMNFLTIISLTDERDVSGNRMVKCQCDCGNVKLIRWGHFRSGGTKSCGCYMKEVARNMMKEQLIPNNIKHADTKGGPHHYLYTLWMGIKQRCYNPNNKRYSTYGARGIGMYEPWINDYVAFKEWVLTNLGERYDANTGKRGDNESFDRIDVNIGYYPGNLRWADFQTQANNKTIHSLGHRSRKMIEEETGKKMLSAKKLQEIYEEYYNVKITKGNVVHHINWDASDNRRKNLLEVTRAEHGWLHQTCNYKLKTESRSSIIKILKNIDWDGYDLQRKINRG